MLLMWFLLPVIVKHSLGRGLASLSGFTSNDSSHIWRKAWTWDFLPFNEWAKRIGYGTFVCPWSQTAPWARPFQVTGLPVTLLLHPDTLWRPWKEGESARGKMQLKGGTKRRGRREGGNEECGGEQCRECPEFHCYLSLPLPVSLFLYTHIHTKTTHLDISHASQSLNFQEELQQRAELWPPNFQLLSALCFFFPPLSCKEKE